MKFYRVHYHEEGGNSGGFSWHTSKRAAETLAREVAREDPEEYADGPPSETLSTLSRPAPASRRLRHASHADNG
jgi:hypothetical protein